VTNDLGNTNGGRLLVACAALLLASTQGGYAGQKQSTVQKSGDLTVVNCRTERVMVRQDLGQHWVRIFATVANLVPGTTTGTFQFIVQRRDHAGGGWESQGQSTVMNPLSYGIADRRAPSKELQSDAYVPIGKRYDFRVTVLAADVKDDANSGNDTCETSYNTVTIGDGGSDGAVIRGVDLVVASVEVRRGTFGGARKVQIIPVIRNMWHGRTGQRIRISIHEYSLAWWIEGGIAGDEEKRGGAVYIDDPTGNAALTFSVVVDSANEIPENNEGNNTCGPIVLGAAQASVIHTCPIVGPHGDLR